MPKNRLLLAVLIVLGVVVVVIIAVPFLVNADSFRPTIESQLQSSLGRQVTIGGLSLSLLAGGVTANDVTISDDPAFNKGPFLKAKSLAVGVKLLPLIFSRSVEVTGITIDRPELTLVHSASGQWNFSSLGSGKKTSPSSGAGNFSVGKLKITNGQVTVEKTGGKPSVYQDVNLTASNISYDSPIPFTVEAKTPGGGKLKVEGSAGPINQADAALTPLQAQVTIDNVDLAATGFLDPSSGIQGLLNYKGTVKSDGNNAQSEGQATVDKLRVVPAGAPAKQSVSLNYASTYNLKREAGEVTRGDVHIGSSTVRLSGDYDMHGAATLVHMKLNGSQLPVKDVEGLLPAVGVTLPAGASLQSGTLTMNLALDGPVDRLVTTGTAQLANARLAGYDLASKMKALSALSFLQSAPGGDTVIQTLSSNLRISPEGIRADNMNLVISSLGALTGSGTIANNNALNFHMVARLAQSSMINQVAKNIPILGGASGGGGSIPFMIQGTTAQPIFVPDVAGALKGAVSNPLQQQQQQNPLGNALQGILGGKKK